MPPVILSGPLRWAALLTALTAPLPALACPAGQHRVCVVACFCAPGSREEMGGLFDDLGQMAASGLEQWLVRSRNSAATGDVRPIPLHIRAQLEPYYDLQVLDSVRYKVGDDAQFTAANTMLQNPDVRAVTLIDIVVFRRADDALDDVALWAHELHHVQQYLQWGVGEFARRYTRDAQAVEAPAYEIQRRVTKALAPEHAQRMPPHG
ncbi:DUF4157 domain-containing protein [Pseudomonas benzenivorans]|uniref:eCIS core domain-containing protein n=1 Tax=Pseudomonas benzenivorans TaxID=556533 RepID=UPI003513AC48